MTYKKSRKELKESIYDNMRDLIAAKEKETRKNRGEQATAIGISPSSLSKYANMDAPAIPDGASLCKMAEYYNCSTDYILGRVKNPSSDIDDVEISNKLGLSDNSINVLKDWHKNKKGYSYLIDILLSYGGEYNRESVIIKLLDEFLYSANKMFWISNADGTFTSAEIGKVGTGTPGKYDSNLLTEKEINAIILLQLQDELKSLKKEHLKSRGESNGKYTTKKK